LIDKTGCARVSVASPFQGEGRVRVFLRITGAWRLQKTPHLSPLPLPRGEAAFLASSSELIINKHYHVTDADSVL
jgi:hypothetical protein